MGLGCMSRVCVTFPLGQPLCHDGHGEKEQVAGGVGVVQASACRCSHIATGAGINRCTHTWCKQSHTYYLAALQGP